MIVAAAAWGLALALPGVAQELRQFSILEVKNILHQNGYAAVEQASDRLLVVSVNGTRYGLFVDDRGDMQGYYGLDAQGVSLEAINEWNRTKRFSRAYLDAERDPVLEADLDAAEGLTTRQVAWFFKLFVSSSDAFRGYVLESR